MRERERGESTLGCVRSHWYMDLPSMERRGERRVGA